MNARCPISSALVGRIGKCGALLSFGLLALSPCNAQGAVVMSGVRNITVSSSVAVQWIDLDGAGTAEFALTREIVDFSESPWLQLSNFSADFDFQPINIDPGLSDKLTSLGSGTTVGAATSFSSSPFADTNFGQFSGPQGAYFGFRFNPTGNQILYGWGQLRIPSLGGGTMTLVQWAYEDSGQAITTPIPEVSSLAALAFGAGLAVIRRRRSDS